MCLILLFQLRYHCQLIRNFYVSGHDLRDDPSGILFELCQFTPWICDGFSGSNQRAYFFTEGKIGAGRTGYDDWVATALMNGYQIALGANQDYRNLAPDWGSCTTTAFTCNYINVGIKNAVVAAQAQQ